MVVSKHHPHALGRGGEVVARRYLEGKGWKLLATNYRFGRREVDIVASRDRVLAFVEVKTRSGLGCGHPEESVTWRKRKEIELVARYFLLDHSGRASEIRFDVVAVQLANGRPVRCEHIEDAWRPGWS